MRYVGRIELLQLITNAVTVRGPYQTEYRHQAIPIRRDFRRHHDTAILGPHKAINPHFQLVIIIIITITQDVVARQLDAALDRSRR